MRSSVPLLFMLAPTTLAGVAMSRASRPETLGPDQLVVSLASRLKVRTAQGPRFEAVKSSK